MVCVPMRTLNPVQCSCFASLRAKRWGYERGREPEKRCPLRVGDQMNVATRCLGKMGGLLYSEWLAEALPSGVMECPPPKGLAVELPDDTGMRGEGRRRRGVSKTGCNEGWRCVVSGMDATGPRHLHFTAIAQCSVYSVARRIGIARARLVW